MANHTGEAKLARHRVQRAPGLVMGGKIIFMTPCWFGMQTCESRMKYAGVHRNAFATHG